MSNTRVRGELGPACTKCQEAKVWCGTRWLCRPCQAAQERARRAALTDAQREVERVRNNRVRNVRNGQWSDEKRAAANAKVAEWREAHREQHRQKSRESYWRRADEVRAAKAAEYAADPVKFFARNLRRKALLREALCEHGPQCVDAEFLRGLYAEPCFYCSAEAKDADHFIPLSGGGLHCRLNLVPACGPCNGSKYNHDPVEWMASRAN